MGDRPSTKPPCVFDTGESLLFTSINGIGDVGVEDSGNEDNNLRQDGLLNDDSNQLVSLST